MLLRVRHHDGLLVDKRHCKGRLEPGDGAERSVTGEQFLNSIRYLDCEITALDNSRCRLESRRQDLLDKAESIGASLDRVQHGISSKTEDIGVQLADLVTPEELARKLQAYQDRINKRIDKLIDLREEATGLIEKLPDARYRTLLMLRYLQNLKWSTVADLMGYTEGWVKNDLRAQAIEAFDKVFENNHLKPPKTTRHLTPLMLT